MSSVQSWKKIENLLHLLFGELLLLVVAQHQNMHLSGLLYALKLCLAGHAELHDGLAQLPPARLIFCE
ncbi:hypothetical protein IT415_03020 [bacterium]|nr:hypothetical protein [bacterium]